MDVLDKIRNQVRDGQYRISDHAHREMLNDGFLLQDLVEGVLSGEVLEDYPEHRRGPCCLLNGTTAGNRPIHIVCTTSLPVAIMITVYEPKPPKWVNPRVRSGKT